jgi:uncharacterized protein (TIGR00730 family)
MRLTVFCGSSLGRSPAYAEAARELGREMVARGLGLVYGGAGVGLMGVLADTVLAGGGEVIGVIPRHLVAREIAHSSLIDLRVVETMHERKALMAELGDAFVALPGGAGTLEGSMSRMDGCSPCAPPARTRSTCPAASASRGRAISTPFAARSARR